MKTLVIGGAGETLTALIGHPRRYEGFVRETAAKRDKDLP
jgi:hypothetical protein